MIILFPSDYFNIKKPDVDYAEEYRAAFSLDNFTTMLFNHDEFTTTGTLKIHPLSDHGDECIYRGWMLTPNQYKSLYDELQKMNIRLINSSEEYNTCHLYPCIYSFIQQDTSTALWFEKENAVDWNLINSTFEKFMVKDYVKSAKETKFPIYFETPVDAEEMERRIVEFVELRDSLYTGGIVFKEYLNFKKYGHSTGQVAKP
jgi:hypothetical protein